MSIDVQQFYGFAWMFTDFHVFHFLGSLIPGQEEAGEWCNASVHNSSRLEQKAVRAGKQRSFPSLHAGWCGVVGVVGWLVGSLGVGCRWAGFFGR